MLKGCPDRLAMAQLMFMYLPVRALDVEGLS